MISHNTVLIMWSPAKLDLVLIIVNARSEVMPADNRGISSSCRLCQKIMLDRIVLDLFNFEIQHIIFGTPASRYLGLGFRFTMAPMHIHLHV